MVLDEPGTPLRAADCPIPFPGRRRAAPARARLRRLPHRPPRARRRGHDRAPARSSRATRSSAWSSAAAPGRARAAGTRVGVPWLGWTDGDLRVLPRAGARTSARARGSPASTSTAASPSCAVADERYCFPLPDELRRPRGRAAAVRRADRPPRAAHDRRRARASGLYGFGAAAHIVCPGRAATRAARVFAFTRAGDDGVPGVRAGARLRVGRRRAGPGPRAARRGDHLRAGRASSCPAALRARAAAAASSSARAST